MKFTLVHVQKEDTHTKLVVLAYLGQYLNMKK